MVPQNLVLPPYFLQTAPRSSKTNRASTTDGENTSANCSTSHLQSAFDQIPQNPTLEQLDDPPSLAEVQRAIKQMSSGKDGIPAELYKAHGEEALQAFHAVLTSIWEEEDMKKRPPQWRMWSLKPPRLSRSPPWKNRQNCQREHREVGNSLCGYNRTSREFRNGLRGRYMTGRQFREGLLVCNRTGRELRDGIHGLERTGKRFRDGLLGHDRTGREFRRIWIGCRHLGRSRSRCRHLCKEL